eukprot:CAMPEP_0201286102 /NCGR_PEP_ID=MMETSP1317-20130820/114263_1 /ASSEMBLY_ACC=CAM_ASM_000770 /TAXON_ID=187299 /ORGANISM="Undescribed Undescribed, Strain Undescribed" /LENGTH=54 /DNA_ID=CAMNT_0047612615 /DNA_START=844 /DNA_END=1008 /DNA_ORIENTATION=-
MPILKQLELSAREHKYGSNKQSAERGKLIVKFDIQFPRFIPEDKKRLLREILPE